MTVVAVFTVGTFPKKNINQCRIVFVFPRVPRRRDSRAIGFFHHVSGLYGYALNTVMYLCTNHPGEVDNWGSYFVIDAKHHEVTAMSL